MPTIDDEDLEQQGQEALLLVEETRSTFLRRTTTTPATRSLLWPNDDDSISKESFEKALLARRTLEGSSMSKELKIILDDAVKKGLSAIENREMDRAKQLLEFIIVPTALQQNNNDATVPQVDTVSSLGFDRSFDVQRQHLPEDLLSMSSLNEILDAPLTPEQKQARFRVFWFGKQKKKKPVNPTKEEDAEPFVTTVVCDDGTMLAREEEENSFHRIEEELRDALEDISTQKAVSSADGVPLLTAPRENKDDSSNAEDASEVTEHLLNESTAQNEVSFISIETTAVDDSNEEEEQPPRSRSQSPLKRLLQRRSTRTKVTVEEKPSATVFETTKDPEPKLGPRIAVSPSTAVGNAVDDEDRYEIDPVVSNEDETTPSDHLESDAFLDVEDRYAVPADACSFCESLWRNPDSLARGPSDRVGSKDRVEKEAPIVDKYAEMSLTQVDENVDHTKSIQSLDNATIKKKKKKRFALFRRRKNTNSKAEPSEALSEPIVPKKPLKGILKAPTKSFPIDEVASVEHSVPIDGGSTSTVTSHDDDAEPDPLVDRLKQHQRCLDHGLPQQQRLDP